MARRKVKKRGRKRKTEANALFLIDHDGTLCDTNPLAYESIKYAFQTTVEVMKLSIINDVDWEKIFSETRGTTEKHLARYLCYACGIPFNKTKQFEEKFYHFRAKWYENMRTSNEYIWDSYYPDTHQLIYDCKKSGRFELWLLSGNPRIVLKERLSNSISDIFRDNSGDLKGAFGEEAYSRQKLIAKALEKSERDIDGFRVRRDRLGFARNVFYVADSRNDFFAGIEVKIKTIWIPSRTLQNTVDIRNEDYVRFIMNTLGERVLIVNDLYTDKVFRFIGLY